MPKSFLPCRVAPLKVGSTTETAQMVRQNNNKNDKMYNLRFDFKGGRRLSRLYDVNQDTGSIAIFIRSIIVEFYQLLRSHHKSTTTWPFYNSQNIFRNQHIRSGYHQTDGYLKYCSSGFQVFKTTWGLRLLCFSLKCKKVARAIYVPIKIRVY